MQVMQYCQPDGTCTAPVVSKEQCAGARDACADKECGAVCASSDGMMQVMQYCQPDGTCAASVVSKEQCTDSSGTGTNTTEDPTVDSAAMKAMTWTFLLSLHCYGCNSGEVVELVILLLSLFRLHVHVTSVLPPFS